MISNKNLHLTTSIVFILIIAFTYGLFPNAVLSKLFDFNVESTDLKQIFRATMGLYLAMVILWTMGVINPAYWLTATISNFFFMSGLALGRIISLVLDGLPTIYFSAGLILELLLAIWGIMNLKKYYASQRFAK